jgi:O-antigen ligase
MSPLRRYWRDRALWMSIAEASVIGHGTGSLRGLFQRAVTGYSNPSQGDIISNSHNQTLDVAVPWGMIGVLLLYAMWLVHLLLFRGEGFVAWLGILVVVQYLHFAVQLTPLRFS